MDYMSRKELMNKLDDAKENSSLHIEGTSETPEVILDRDEGLIKISGRSLPENAKDFYNPIIEWIEGYLSEPTPSTKVVFHFEYFNTASSKMIWECIEEVNKLQEKDSDVKVEWHYLQDDDDMLEAGQDYEEMIGIEFTYVPYE
jgi:hypothetical protein